ncbi:MAG: peptidoglycan-associated lipoprotein Pal [Elusimicrobiota bacterium]|jgi:peptidoglycan-associated lipoprotein
MRHPTLRLSLLLALGFALAGAACAPKKALKANARSSGAEGSEDSSLSAGAPGVDVEEAAIRGKEYVAVGDLQPVRFDYDSYALDDAARETLKANADYLKAHGDLEVLVEGHTDERGTVEYNLALGQKRAKEARDYMLRLGVNGKRVGTISFGKERPSCTRSDEGCWGQNRRAETKVRARTASSSTAQ